MGYADPVSILFVVVPLAGGILTRVLVTKRKKRKGWFDMRKPKVAFICVHNSCRSQVAEALGKHHANHTFESYSAGTEAMPQINQDAVRLMKQLYGIDMEQTQRGKLLEEILAVDVVVTMGCNVQCTYLPCKHREDWGLDDPGGKDDAAFTEMISLLQSKIIGLVERIQKDEL